MASLNDHALELASTGSPLSKEIWTDYHRVTPSEVARSCTYYFTYGDDQKNRIITTFQWSYRHFERNVESALYTRIHNEFLYYPLTAQGGPIFFKLLMDTLSISNDAHLLALQNVVYAYNISKDSEGEDIIEVVAVLKGIAMSFHSIKKWRAS